LKIEDWAVFSYQSAGTESYAGMSYRTSNIALELAKGQDNVQEFCTGADI
jgi:hypothetical protein